MPMLPDPLRQLEPLVHRLMAKLPASLLVVVVAIFGAQTDLKRHVRDFQPVAYPFVQSQRLAPAGNPRTPCLCLRLHQ